VQRARILEAWGALDGTARFVWNKLVTGGFRVGVSQSLVVTRALAARVRSTNPRSRTD
jgi:DNA ligase 1